VDLLVPKEVYKETVQGSASLSRQGGYKSGRKMTVVLIMATFEERKGKREPIKGGINKNPSVLLSATTLW
jgi:hypothetical protein